MRDEAARRCSLSAHGCRTYPIGVDTDSGTLVPFKPPRLAAGERDRMVAVPEGYWKTVFYLCIDAPDGNGAMRRKPVATGFFVRVPLEGDGEALAVDYLITARHCIEEARAYGAGGSVYIRFNKKVGGFAEIATQVDDWVEHDTADIAALMTLPSVLPKGITPADLDTSSLNLSSFVGPGPHYRVKGTGEFSGVDVQPRVGHEVYFLGLFTEHAGSDRNLPIARFGHISRMPDFIEIEHGSVRFKTIAYLVEFHSIGGHSGSPVFFLYPINIVTPVRHEENETEYPLYDIAHMTGLMGLVTGHYPIIEESRNSVGATPPELNSGIAVVTPACAIKELLMRKDFVNRRKELRKNVEKKGAPTPRLDFDSASGFTCADMERALKKVSRRRRPLSPGQASSGT